MIQPPHIAIIGAGIFVRTQYIPRLAEISDHAVVRAIWSRTEESARGAVEIARKVFPDVECKWGETGLDEIIQDSSIIGVAVVLAGQAQVDMSLRLLKAGKHVLQEKPAISTISEADTAFSCYNSICSNFPCQPIWAVAENYRFEPAFVESKKLLAKIGDMKNVQVIVEGSMNSSNPYFSSSWRRDFTGGFILDMGVHFIAGLRMVSVAQTCSVPLLSCPVQYSRKFLEARRPNLYWTPCAAHCLDLMLEDIFKLPNLKKAFERAISIHGYIYNRLGLLNMMRRFTNFKELVKPAKTRFATAFLTLQRLYSKRNELRTMFTSNEWNTSKWAKEPQGKKTTQILLMPSFWNTVHIALKFACPLVHVLRLVDGEKKPPMGYIYEAMDRAKEVIANSFDENEDKYKDVFEIIDRRWNVQLHRPLHAAGFYLNPEFYYKNPEAAKDKEISTGLFQCISKLVKNVEVQDRICEELTRYEKAEGLFGIPMAVRQRTTRVPAEWWGQYGRETPNLQTFAIRVLSLTCSASGCERNWSVFEHLVGCEVTSVSAVTSHVDSTLPPPDNISSVFQLENGCSGVFAMVVNSRSPKILWRVVGLNGTLQVERGYIDGQHGYLVSLYTADGESKNFYPFSGVTEELKIFLSDISKATLKKDGSYEAEPRSSFVEGVRDVAVLEAMLDSGGKQGSLVHVKFF